MISGINQGVKTQHETVSVESALATYGLYN